jgi:tetratricopeptide (TPR) repeat protein
LIVVVAIQLLPQPIPQAVSEAPLPSVQDVDPLKDITPAGQIGQVVIASGVDTSDTDRRISFWQERLRSTPGSDTAWTVLGDLLDIKGRQTGDLTNFSAARDAYETALGIAPGSPEAQIGIAHIRNTLHDFNGALEAATAVLETNPGATGALAVVFDAAAELGDLDIAEQALASLKERADSPAVTIREARFAFLKGDGATASQLSLQAASNAEEVGDSPAGLAFYHFAAGEYAFLNGDADAAVSGYRAAEDILPGYALAIAGEGRVAFAHEDIPGALELFESAAAAIPRPDFLAYLGDLYTLTGDSQKAADQYATVDFIAGLASTTAGPVYDREYATFLVDHGRDAAHALSLAQAEIEQRQDIYGYDVLAWALHANGRDAEALEASRKALGLGTVDGKLFIHAGLIELANGLTTEGKAHLQEGLDLHPGISPLVFQAATEALEQ